MIKSIAVAGALLAAGCAGAGTVYDEGRTARQMENAPVHDNDVVGREADPSIRVIDRRIETPFGGKARPAPPTDAAAEPDEEARAPAS